MTLPETVTAAGPRPTISVLLTTYNRSSLLRRSLGSILGQDFTDFEVVIVDDQSTDDTPDVVAQYDDPRIRYIRNKENMARKGGDRSIFQRFVNEQARGDFFLWLCDDDYWIPMDLLSRQIRIMRENPGVSMIFGGMAQLYPTPIALPVPNAPYLTYEFVGDSKQITFARNVFPNGYVPSETYLRLFAEDPKNRNSVTGATMFRMASFRKADAFAHGQQVRWQSGYLMFAGTASVGDVWYLDEPCVVATVELNSASYRGTQHDHMVDCLRSIDAAFYTALRIYDAAKCARLRKIRSQMMCSIIKTYLANKISYRLGWFGGNPLEGIEKALVPEITGRQFIKEFVDYRIFVSPKIIAAIVLSSLPAAMLNRLQRELTSQRIGWSPDWWLELVK